MIQYVEAENRVFRLEVTPDAPGWRRRTFSLTVESGPPLTREEYQRLSACFVADLVSRGVVVHSWSAVPFSGEVEYGQEE